MVAMRIICLRLDVMAMTNETLDLGMKLAPQQSVNMPIPCI
jgi:hypothetical protein